MAWVAIVLVVAAAAYSAYSSYQQGKAQEDMYEYQQDVQEYNAALERQNAEYQARKHRKDVQRLLASQRAHLSASGLDISMGSPLELMADTAYEGEMDAQEIIYAGEMRATGLQHQADLSGFQGKVAYWSGKQKAYGTLLSGAASGASMGAASYGGGAQTTQSGSVSQGTQTYSPNAGYGGGEGGARGY